jgi:hypothetical protein
MKNRTLDIPEESGGHDRTRRLRARRPYLALWIGHMLQVNAGDLVNMEEDLQQCLLQEKDKAIDDVCSGGGR